MEKFIYLFRSGDAGLSAEAMQAHMQKWFVWMEQLAKQGHLILGEPLQQSGKQVNGSKKTVTDGPFIEAKEMIGGVMIVNANDIDHAVDISKGCPIFDIDGKVEVRPIQKMEI